MLSSFNSFLVLTCYIGYKTPTALSNAKIETHTKDDKVSDEKEYTFV